MWFPVMLLGIGFMLLLLFFLYMHNDVGTIKLFLENDHFLTVRQELDSLKILASSLETRVHLLENNFHVKSIRLENRLGQPIHRSDLDKKCIEAAQTLFSHGYIAESEDKERQLLEEVWQIIRNCFDE